MEKTAMTPEERRRKKKKILRERRGKVYIKVTCVFLFFIVVIFVANLISGDKSFSESENRVLAQKPEFSLSSLISGDFMSDMEDYVADQFVLRDQWISLKLFEDMALGKRESNGVYIGKQDTLLEIPDEPNTQSLENNLNAIREFSQRHVDINTVMTLVPNAAYICDQLRPNNAPVRDQSQDIANARAVVGDSLNFVDLVDTMSSHKTEYIYYKTDHHWTSLGAKYAFDALCPALGITDPVIEYDVYPVSTTFSGTLASKSGYHKAEDTIEIYVAKDVNTDCVVNYIDEQRKTASIYDSTALDQKDHYEVFFGGNFSRVDISTPNEQNKNLLLLKDSYANCFVQFLLPYYRNIIMVDPRYYYDDLDLLIESNGITDILFLYNVNTFMTDTSLAAALEAAPQDENASDGTPSQPAAEGESQSSDSGQTDSAGDESGSAESGTESGEGQSESSGAESDTSEVQSETGA